MQWLLFIMMTSNTLSVTNISLVSSQDGQRLLDASVTMAFGEMPPWGYTTTAIVLFFIGFFGFFFNLFVIFLMCKDLQVGDIFKTFKLLKLQINFKKLVCSHDNLDWPNFDFRHLLYSFRKCQVWLHWFEWHYPWVTCVIYFIFSPSLSLSYAKSFWFHLDKFYIATIFHYLIEFLFSLTQNLFA